MRNQPGGKKKVGRKPKDTGQELKTLSATDNSVTTAFEHVRSLEINSTREFSAEYGNAGGCVLRLCKKGGQFGSKRRVIADSWFANLSLARGLRKEGGLHLLGMVKTGSAGFPKKELTAKLEGKERGAWATATMKLDKDEIERENDEKVMAIAWKGKSEKVKGKARKLNWITTFIATDCTLTTKGVDAEKKDTMTRGEE